MDRSLLSTPGPFEDSIGYDKENAERNNALNTMLPTSPAATAQVLTPVALNQDPDSPAQLRKTIPMEMSLDEDKLTAMVSPERKIGGFGEGVRRESFPRKYVHTPDVSFNCEEFISDKSYSSDVTHDEGMSFAYNVRSSTPVSAHEVPIPPTVQRTRAGPDIVEPASNALSEPASKVSRSTLSMGLEGLDQPLKPRTSHPRSPLSFEVDAGTEGKHAASTQESDLVPIKRDNPSGGLQLNGNFAPPAIGLKSISARAAALRFILPEDSLMEMDSILDVQFPGGMEDEFTAAFARLALGTSGSEPKVTEPRLTPGSAVAPQERVLVGSDQHGSLAIVERKSQSGVGSTELNPVSDEANDSHLEDEHTLNIASLGLSGMGNTLLMDTSLDQLRSKPNEVEHGDVTFGGSSFMIANSSATGWSTGATLEAHTPKRTGSNPLPPVEGAEMGVEATVRKPQASNGRVTSEVLIDALRSGRALHRATSSVSSISGTTGLVNNMDRADERSIGKQVWPGSTASLRRTESFTTYPHPNTAEPRQYPGSAMPLQRTRSTMSLRRTSSVTSYQPDFMRPHSRASVVDVDSEEEQPYTPSIPTMSRGSSRRSSVYALPEPGIPSDHPASYFDRPSSVASIYDRPTSSASVRPTSAASIRPTSAASIRTSSTRSTSVAGSLRSESATSSRRVSGAHVRTSSAEDEFVNGMESHMRGGACKVPATPTARSNQDIQNIRNAKVAGVEGSAIKDKQGVPRSAIRPLGLSTPRPVGSALGAKSGLGLPKSLGPKILSGVPGSKQPVGSSTRATGLGSSAKTMSAASGRSVPITPGSGTRSTASTLRSQSSINPPAVRSRATTLGLFAPDGGPGEGQEPKKLAHKVSSASISATPSTTRILRPPATTSGTRTLVPRGTNAITGSTRAVAGSIASLREAMKSKETSKR
ncbi:unnamed protein product [Rhizoctonia solani]|uniref:Uncharacterized protein n=1 Tax=Rhizoctonia solani TaxID=456999 RepID=A0A8H3GMI5_9AGAM|nr:unnamed protein product [Rhizoctonia solani]